MHKINNSYINQLVYIYNQLESELVEDIINRFNTYDEVKGSLEWNLAKLNELGGVNKTLVEILQGKSSKSKFQIETMLQNAGYTNLDEGEIDEVYKAEFANVKADQLLRSERLRDVIEHSYMKMENGVFKMIKTKAVESNDPEYMNILNKAYVDAASGFHSINQITKTAIEEMTKL